MTKSIAIAEKSVKLFMRHYTSKEASRTITVWDLEGGRKLSTLRGHSDSVNDVSLTSDGTQIVSASDDQTVRTWEPESGHELCVLQGHTDSVYMVRICPDGQRLVSASQDRTLKMWDLRSGLCMATFTGDDIVTCCSITRDTRTLVAVDSSGRIHFLRTVLPDDPAEKRKPGLR